MKLDSLLTKHPAQRVGIFIDVQNMYYSAKNLFGAKVNFGNIVKEAVAGRQLVRAIAYVVETPQQHEVRFLDALKSQGIELKQRDLQIFSGGAKKADWDVGITVDAIRIGEVLDVVVLVSGDGDFIPLVEYLQNKGRQVEVMAFRETASTKLVEAADHFTDLAERKELFLIRDSRYAEKASAAREMREAHEEELRGFPQEKKLKPTTRRRKRTIL